MSDAELGFFESVTAGIERLTQRSLDDNETIGELARAVNEYQAEVAELRDELHELAGTVRRGQDKRLSEAAEPLPVLPEGARYWCGNCRAYLTRAEWLSIAHDHYPTTTETRS